MKTRLGGNGGVLSAGLIPAPLPSRPSAFAAARAVTATGFLATAAPRPVAGSGGGSWADLDRGLYARRRALEVAPVAHLRERIAGPLSGRSTTAR